MDDKWNCMVSHEFMVVNHDSNTCGLLFGFALRVAIYNLPNGEYCCGGKSSSPPLKPEFFVEISVDPQNYRSFPHIFFAGRC